VAKERTRYICQECGRVAPKPLGRCPQCGAWNSMQAEVVHRSRPASPARRDSRAVPLFQVEGGFGERMPLRMGEFARVLGGGVVPGSLVLIAGDPGIGKSTLLLQVAMDVAENGRVLYVSGEESGPQLKGRATRVIDDGRIPEQLYLLTETHLEVILAQIEAQSPTLVVVDSIQTIESADVDSSAGSVTQVRETASRFRELAKGLGIAIFLVGHVTKQGAIAGPRVLEHIVDSVLYLEGDRFHSYRLLRSVKNRFGPTTEVGVFEMRAGGMKEVSNPSQVFLAERVENEPGSAVAVTMEGTRPLLAEIQGLTSPTAFGHPRRTANGVDFNRLLLTIAVLTRRLGMQLSDQDVFVNVVGGLRVSEPAADLAVAAAIASSVRNRAYPAEVVFVGEIGLSGELRSVSHGGARIREAAKLGFRKVLVPFAQKEDPTWPKGISVTRARSVRDALRAAVSGADSAAS
jgi:DNA repair protein RadA/Sms